jgi:hypothetical protein
LCEQIAAVAGWALRSRSGNLCPMPEPILDAFRFEAARLGEDFARASALGEGTSAEVADHRENAFRSLVRRFFPAPHHVTKGQVTGVDGSRSASIDCLVLSPAHPHLIDGEGKFSLILADGVDLAADAKGRLDGAELLRFLNQARSIKKVSRSKTPLLFLELLPDRRIGHEEASLHIPTYAYCHASALTPETMAKQIAAWVEEGVVPWTERPDAVAVHDKGVLVDTSSPLSPGRRLLGADAVDGLYWIETAELTLGQVLLLMSMGVPAQEAFLSPIILRYAAVSGTPHLLHQY